MLHFSNGKESQLLFSWRCFHCDYCFACGGVLVLHRRRRHGDRCRFEYDDATDFGRFTFRGCWVVAQDKLPNTYGQVAVCFVPSNAPVVGRKWHSQFVSAKWPTSVPATCVKLWSTSVWPSLVFSFCLIRPQVYGLVFLAIPDNAGLQEVEGNECPKKKRQAQGQARRGRRCKRTCMSTVPCQMDRPKYHRFIHKKGSKNCYTSCCIPRTSQYR